MEALSQKQVNLLETNPYSLTELKGWREKQEALAKENSFIAIIDSSTYKEAKKRRTALVKGRTTIKEQQKLIIARVNKFKNIVTETSKDLIDITLPAEEKQQTEVKRYEKEKEEEKQRKLTEEQDRVNGINERINSFVAEWKAKIQNITIDSIESFDTEFSNVIKEIELTEFQEFENEFTLKLGQLKNEAENFKNILFAEEKNRKEREELAAQRKKLEEEKRIADEAARIEREALEKQRKKQEEDLRLAGLEAKRRREEEENKLIEERKAIEAEKKRLKKIEDDRLEKIRAEKRAEELKIQKKKEEEGRLAKEEAERKRLEALQPEKEKLIQFINSLNFSNTTPEVKDAELQVLLKNTLSEIAALKSKLINRIETLK